MDAHSETFLAHVHPDLARVLRAAAQTPQPWAIVYGIRTLAAEAQAVATGHSQTMRSRHLPDIHYANKDNPDGVACAVDVAAIIGGRLDWAKGREAAVFGEIADQIRAAAKALNIPLQWGGDPIGAWTPGVVSHFRDWGHFQLPWGAYP